VPASRKARCRDCHEIVRDPNDLLELARKLRAPDVTNSPVCMNIVNLRGPPAGPHRANGRRACRCLVWDEKTDMLLEQCLQRLQVV
jgi:hypothetical protein